MPFIILNIIITVFTAQLVFSINSISLNKKLQKFQEDTIDACAEGVAEYMKKNKEEIL